jgi:putative transposase
LDITTILVIASATERCSEQMSQRRQMANIPSIRSLRPAGRLQGPRSTEKERTMPRRQRIHVPGGTYYVVRRTHSTRPVFSRPEDYALFEELLRAALKRTGSQLFGYCWMPEGIHLALQVDTIPVGNLMRELASRYARGIQSRSGDCGQFFRRPYQSTLIDPSSHLATLIQYLHHIPVMEGLVARPDDYKHSSHRAYLGEVSSSMLNIRPVLQLLDCLDHERTTYRRLLERPPSATVRAMLERGRQDMPGVLGDDEFFAGLPRRGRTMRSTRSLEDIAEHVVRVHDLQRAQLLSRSRRQDLVLARAQLAWYATERRVATLCEVARYLRRSASSLTRAIASHQRRQPELFTFDAFTSFVPIVPWTSSNQFGPGFHDSPALSSREAGISHDEARRADEGLGLQAW